jgi:hypothetical protein
VEGYSKAAKATGEPETAISQTANHGLSIWKRLVNGTTVAVGCDDIFGQDPPHALGNYPVFEYDPSGRFVYLSITKKF